MSLLRSTIELANRLTGRAKAGRRRAPPAGLASVRLNLGCGLAVVKGWINIDGSLNALVAGMPPALHRLVYRLTGARVYYSEADYCRLLREHMFMHHDLATGIPLRDGTVDYVFSSHFLEHLVRRDADHLLRDCLRVLKPGGMLRLSVPDLEYALSLYSRGLKDKMLQDYFFVDEDNNYFSQHKYMYDFDMLSAQLAAMGFGDITRRQYRQGRCPDVELLDNRPEDSLFIEAVKPA